LGSQSVSQSVCIDGFVLIVSAGQKSSCLSLKPDPWLHETDIFSDGCPQEFRKSGKFYTKATYFVLIEIFEFAVGDCKEQILSELEHTLDIIELI